MVIDSMEKDCLYIIGPGTTTRAIMEQLNLPYTLLGVDVTLNKELVAADVTEKTAPGIYCRERGQDLVTIIGGQGYIFGRATNMLSPAVLGQVGKENVIVITPQTKSPPWKESPC